MASPNEKRDVHPASGLADEKPVGRVAQVNTASVALAAAVAEQKPNLWSRNMIRLYFIMGIGYLVSTLNGFGILELSMAYGLAQMLTLEQTAPSWAR